MLPPIGLGHLASRTKRARLAFHCPVAGSEPCQVQVATAPTLLLFFLRVRRTNRMVEKAKRLQPGGVHFVYGSLELENAQYLVARSFVYAPREVKRRNI